MASPTSVQWLRTWVQWLRRQLATASVAADRKWGWPRFPVVLALAILLGVRDELREKNLHDYGSPPAAPPPSGVDHLTARTADGSYNHLDKPSMGMAGTRFGRNVPLVPKAAQYRGLFDPNPFTVSAEFLLRAPKDPATGRDGFKRAETLNVLAAAWIQFQIHDWFSHGTDPEPAHFIQVPAPDGSGDVGVPRTPRDPHRLPDYRTFVNNQSHWWDGAQMYGATQELQDLVRAGDGKIGDGKVRISADHFLNVDPPKNPTPTTPAMFTGDGWWLGLELMTTVFLREHNAICDRLKASYPVWTDEQLFNKARLINAALIAKIHTTEWTPAILDHKGFKFAAHTNWYGLAGSRVKKVLGRLTYGDLLSGVLGGHTELFGVPYSITEEFVSVYRMHPLMPDDYTFYDLNGAVVAQMEFNEINGYQNSRDTLKAITQSAALYSLGVANPGAVTLHNGPRFMQNFVRTVDNVSIDLNAVDILRSRERGVPRYNEFRRLLHLNPAKSFAEISGGDDDSDETAARLAEIYDNDIEKVDTIVGLYGEKLPKGFGFSDTAFRIFSLMAIRRLEADRFYTVDFTPRVYTPEGMAWIEDNDMISVLLRHYPDLGPILRNQRNAFAPWNGYD